VTDKLQSLRQTSERLGVSIFTVRRLVQRRALLAVRVGKRVLVPESEIERATHEGCPVAQEPKLER
jgi:excisionase family DNA binding protein